jgi:molybdopterin converting factor small subunit
MSLSSKQQSGIARILERLASPEPDDYRGGVRAIAHQVVQRNGEVVHELRRLLAELRDREFGEAQRAFHECLLDVLRVADEQFERDLDHQRAERALSVGKSAPLLRSVMECLWERPTTAAQLSIKIERSEPQVGRYLSDLRDLGLVMPFPSTDGRERPFHLTPLGEKLLHGDASAAAPTPELERDEVAQIEALATFVDRTAERINEVRSALNDATLQINALSDQISDLAANVRPSDESLVSSGPIAAVQRALNILKSDDPIRPRAAAYAGQAEQSSEESRK